MSVCCYYVGGMIRQQNTDVARQKPVAVPLCPPQVPRGLTCNWYQAATSCLISDTVAVQQSRHDKCLYLEGGGKRLTAH